MKKLFLNIIIVLFVGLVANAQQYPLYTQSTFNNFSVNPAFAGSEKCIDFRAGYRMQWAGFDGAPGTGFLNGHGKIKPKVLNGKDWFMGVGGRIISDEAGPFSSIRLELAGAIHVQLSKTVYASMGVFAGTLQSRFSADGLSSDTSGTNLVSNNSFLTPTVTPGILVYSRDFYMGFSIQDIVKRDLKDISSGSSAGTNTNISPHYIFKTAKNFKISNRSEIIPSLIVRTANGAPVNFELNMMYSLDKDYQIGVAYRNQEAFAALLKLRLFGTVSLGFAYDFVFNNLKHGTTGSYEIILGFNACDLSENQNIRCAAFN